ncbi:uncharacterized protein LOC113274431 [Papaver somniferum]|uniref:uncharacterized protein LOC113274431 n=1 Tax=Papaver somniferum TaxID=3469 RepID=UPI000E70314A|nr:uncharacterized protein LOC113274431 [Papaver somniferum]
MSQFFTLFADSMEAMGNDELQRNFDMVSKICDTPCLDDPSLRRASTLLNPIFQFAFGSLMSRMSYVISSDYERRLQSLEAKLKNEVSNSANTISELRKRNDQLDEKEKKQLEDIEELKKQLEGSRRLSDELCAKFTARDSKYRKLKKNYITTV